jgi:hypothetical protein
MDQMKCDARGSAWVFKAAFMLFTNPNMTVDDAMKAAEFTKREISRRAVRQSISKKKNRLLQASARRSNQSTLPPVQNITVSESSAANVSSLSNESSEATMLDDNPPEIRVMDNSETTNLTTRKSSSTKGKKGKNVAHKGRTHKTSSRAFAKVHLSKDSKRTPSQVMKADKERKEGILQLEKAYEWAVSQADKHENRAKLARVASDLYNVIVVPQTLRRLIKEGRKKSYHPVPSRQWTKMSCRT